MTDKADWLAGLQVGDLVYVTADFTNPFEGARWIKRCGKTFIVTDNNLRFRRNDGYTCDILGRRRSFPTTWIEKPTAETVRAAKVDRILKQVEAIRWKSVPTATLKAVLALVPKASKGSG